MKLINMLNYAIFNNTFMLYMLATFKKLFAKQVFYFITFQFCF